MIKKRTFAVFANFEKMLKVSLVSRRGEAGERERPTAAKVMKPLGELNGRTRVAL